MSKRNKLKSSESDLGQIVFTDKKKRKFKLSDDGLKSLLESFNRVKKELPIL